MARKGRQPRQPRGVTRLRSADRAITPIVRMRTTSDDLAAAQFRLQNKRVAGPKQGRAGSFDPQGDAGKKFL